jgi:hypothetical protein
MAPLLTARSTEAETTPRAKFVRRQAMARRRQNGGVNILLKLREVATVDLRQSATIPWR